MNHKLAAGICLALCLWLSYDAARAYWTYQLTLSCTAEIQIPVTLDLSVLAVSPPPAVQEAALPATEPGVSDDAAQQNSSEPSPAVTSFIPETDKSTQTPEEDSSRGNDEELTSADPTPLPPPAEDAAESATPPADPTQSPAGGTDKSTQTPEEDSSRGNDEELTSAPQPAGGKAEAP